VTARRSRRNCSLTWLRQDEVVQGSRQATFGSRRGRRAAGKGLRRDRGDDPVRRPSLDRCQHRAVDLYWRIGEYISRKLEAATWGEGVVDEVARYIQRHQPNLRAFTRRNLFRMRQFFDTYKGQKKKTTGPVSTTWTPSSPWATGPTATGPLHLVDGLVQRCSAGAHRRARGGPGQDEGWQKQQGGDRDGDGTACCSWQGSHLRSSSRERGTK
jgi:hypothetical protein